MLKEKLEQKLKQFLEENNKPHYEDSIQYEGLRKTGTIDGKIRMFHIFSINDQPYDGDASYYASFDENKHHLVSILGPQSYERIGE